MSSTSRVGVLALQGDFAAHAAAVRLAGGEPILIREVDGLKGLDGLILPGGESTTLLRLMREYGFDDAVVRFHNEGGSILGTCAGLILLASKVLSPEQPTLGLLDLVVRRNGFGRQVDSFIDTGVVNLNGRQDEPMEMVFIRAPRIESVGEGVEVIGRWKGEPTLVRQGRLWGATFHPELSDPPILHRHFLHALSD